MKLRKMIRAAAAAALVGAVVFGVTGCGGNDKGDTKAKENPKELTMYMGVVEQSAKVIAADFEKDTGIHVNFVRMSGGETLSRIRAEKDNPQASVWYGGSADSFIMAKKKGCWKHINLQMRKKLRRNSRILMAIGLVYIRDIWDLSVMADILRKTIYNFQNLGMIC